MVSVVASMKQLRPHALSQSAVNEAARTGMRACMNHWIDRMLPQHFERSAHGRYGYESRTRKWNETKAKKKYARSRILGVWIRAPRPVRDNVWSGDSMAALVRPHSTYRVVPRATANRVHVSAGLDLNRGAFGLRRDSRFFDEISRIGPDGEELAGIAVAVAAAAMIDGKG